MEKSTLISYAGKLTREQLALVPTPMGTASHKPIPHHEVIQALTQTLGFRHINIHKEEYCVNSSGEKMFGLLELDQINEEHGVRFSLGMRNSHDKSMRLAMTVGYRVFVCENMAFKGDFQPVLAKHSKNFNLQDATSVGVDQMQRNFEPMIAGISKWRDGIITDVTAKLVIYQAFIEAELDVAGRLAKQVHENYFNPKIDAFRARNMWSLSNAFTAAFKELDATPQFQATAKLAAFLDKIKG